MNIVLLGAPGSGKGTLAKQITKEFGWPQISTGDILRANIKENTDLGKIAKKHMDNGHLVPDELVIELLFGKPKEYTQINNLVEAIRHGLSGCGKIVPNGPILTNKMKNHSSWKKLTTNKKS